MNTSDDVILKQDMPPALHRVEEAASDLLEASIMLRDDSFSAPARKKLINGSRGVYEVVSLRSLLLPIILRTFNHYLKQCDVIG